MHQSVPVRRIEAIDLARGLALIAMAVYHFAWDLEFFGYADPGMTAVGGWKFFARSIASSFLFLVGVSLYLAHAKGIRWTGFWRRLFMVAGAAAAITLVTWFATPESFIFFGILHQIAVASLLGLLFVGLPWPLVFTIAVAVIAAPFWLATPALDAPFWWWTGLSEIRPRSNDYVPLFPWFGAVLCGIAAAGASQQAGILDRLARLAIPRWSGLVGFAGRHSLAFYLLHQPVLIACVFLFAQAFPPERETPQVQFRQACEATCSAERSAEFCSFYCVCVLDAVERENLLDAVFSSDQNGATRSRLTEMADICTAETSQKLDEGGSQ